MGHDNRRDAGFTLVELLASLLIITIMTGLVATAITTATHLYANSKFESQSQLLCSTIDTSFADSAHFAVVSDDGSGNLIWCVPLQGAQIDNAQLVLVDGDTNPARKVLAIRGVDSESGTTTTYPLTNEGAYGNCTLSNLSGTFTSAPTGASSTRVFSFTVTDLSDSSLTHTYELQYTAPANATKDH